MVLHPGDSVIETGPAKGVEGTRWDPKQYLKFADHRLRPALELLDRVPIESPKRIYDLGCGTGDVTRIIASRWPSAWISGLDNSPEMLRKAELDTGRIEWIEADIEHWAPEHSPDLIYSNAALHWLPDHPQLFPRLAGLLSSGCCLAVQMPLSWNATSHQLMRETLMDCGIAGRLLGTEELRAAVARNPVEDAETYFDLLNGCSEILDIWETEYLQVLSGIDPVFEWVQSTGLRPILNGLEKDELEIFVPTYKQRLREAYPIRSNDQTLYPFRRLFIVATA
jgi:trans-aconitate 2-methyltransferase